MSLLELPIGWLAPPDCLVCGLEGHALCSSCVRAHIKPFGNRCWRCNSLSVASRTCIKCRSAGPLSHVWISTSYENAARQLVRQFKFGHLRAASEVISQMMADTIRASAFGFEHFVVIPIPTATSRTRQRGFGHGELLAKAVAAQLKMEYLSSLRRLDQTRQLGSPRHDRLVQLKNSFAVKNRGAVAGQKILLVDDVLTTGGSLIAAAETLKSAGAAQVSALVFAKKL